MTNKEIKQAEKDLSAISKLSFDDQPDKLLELGRKIGINPPHNPNNQRQGQVIYMTQAINSFLQTKMMLNACVSAKWSCFWAAIAAIASCISVLLVLFCA
jgi:hypothetical protein